MYEYRVRNDPCRPNDQKVSQSELKSHMYFVTHVPMDEIFPEVMVEPFHWGNSPSKVSAIFLLYYLTTFGRLIDMFFLPHAQIFKAYFLEPHSLAVRYQQC